MNAILIFFSYFAEVLPLKDTKNLLTMEAQRDKSSWLLFHMAAIVQIMRYECNIKTW